MLDLLVLQRDREGIKRQRRLREWRRRGDYFKYFRQRGAIIQGTAIIQGNTVSYYPLLSGLFRDNLQHWLGDFARLVTVQFTGNEGMSNDVAYQRGGGGECSEFQVTGMVEWGQKPKPKKSPRRKLTPKQSHAKFPGLKSFQKVLKEII